jgi:chloramphenicol-sensitive protein RarD
MTRGINKPTRTPAEVGVLYGLAAFGAWGLAPIYFKAVAHVPAEEVLAHRVIWSALLLGVLILTTGRARDARSAVADRQTLITLCGSTLLIGTNWYLFIWAVSHNLLLQASLGYFINPLFNVLLGFVFLRERLRPAQVVSVALAAIGVTYVTVSYGQFPWLAIAMASSFGVYGLLRKTARVGPLVGLTVETVFLFPLALAYVVYLGVTGGGAFGTVSWWQNGLLMFAGVMTSVPLLWFTHAARGLRLATVGFMQYISPTGHFLLAVLAYGEPFSHQMGICFAFIWVALILYSIDTFRAQSRSGTLAAVRAEPDPTRTGA